MSEQDAGDVVRAAVAVPDEDDVIEGAVMTEQDVDRMRILSWWASYSRRPANG